MSGDNQICRFLGAETTGFADLETGGGTKNGEEERGAMGKNGDLSHGRE